MDANQLDQAVGSGLATGPVVDKLPRAIADRKSSATLAWVVLGPRTNSMDSTPSSQLLACAQATTRCAFSSASTLVRTS